MTGRRVLANEQRSGSFSQRRQTEDSGINQINVF